MLAPEHDQARRLRSRVYQQGFHSSGISSASVCSRTDATSICTSPLTACARVPTSEGSRSRRSHASRNASSADRVRPGSGLQRGTHHCARLCDRANTSRCG